MRNYGSESTKELQITKQITNILLKLSLIASVKIEKVVIAKGVNYRGANVTRQR